MMATHQRKESACTDHKIPDFWFSIVTFRAKGSSAWKGTHGPGSALFGDVHAPLQLDHALHGARGNVRFSRWMSRLVRSEANPGTWSLSIVVNFRLKQKMQTWLYSLGRNPRVYLEQAPPRTHLACSAQPTGVRRERFCYVTPKAGQSLEEDKNGE
jgi:hypothetical protein